MKRLAILLGLLLSGGLCLLLPEAPGLSRLEGLLYDLEITLAQRLFPQRISMDPRIVVVGVEPDCYQSIQRHPVFWLDLYARAARRALDGGARVVGLHVLPTYVEPQAQQEWAALAAAYPGRVVLIGYWVSAREPITAPPASLVQTLGLKSLALANLSLDDDGIGRAQQVQPMASNEAQGSRIWPFFAPTLVERSGTSLVFEEEQVYLNPSRQEPKRICFHRFLEGDGPELRDCLVLIGSRARSDQDLVRLPGPPPGQRSRKLAHSTYRVDYQAQVTNTLLSGRALRPVPVWQSALVLALLLALLLVAGHEARLRANTTLLIGSLSLWLGLALLVLVAGDLLLPLTPGAIGVPFCWGAAMAYRSWRATRERHWLQRTIAGYVAPEILREMLAEPSAWRRSLNQRRDVTVLFSDINGFSAASERESPETVAAWLNEYYREMAHLIFRHQGTIMRFVGDQFMVLFGSPKSVPEPERSAVRTALAMHERLAQLQKEGRGGFYSIKVGIHCGSLLLAVIGDDLKREYTAIGDEANLAARIQDLCKKLGQTTLVSHEVAQRLKDCDEFTLREQGRWEVKGRAQPVHVYSVEAKKRDHPEG